MSEWKEVKLSMLGNIITGKTPRTVIEENYGGDIPFLTPSDDMSVKHVYFTKKTLSEKGVMEVKNCLLPSGSVCVSCIGSDLGKVVITTCNTVTNQQINSIVVNEKNNNDFVYYLLTIVGKELNRISKTSTAVPIINKSSFSSYEVKIPDLFTQSKIAGILSSLDAKIETNNKLNEKLEEMAQAIFKSWFVDFEPFKNQPFHETEIGYIPQIFESGVLGDLCTFKRGKGLLSKDAIQGDVPVIAGGMKPACYHNVANTKAPVVTVSGSGANAGYTQIHNVDVWASDCSFIDSNCENLYYAYCFLSRRPKLLKHSQTGAAQPHVKPADIHRFQVVIPTKEIINEFQEIVKPLFDRIGMNKIENDRLASLRDTLLPRLMSGEIKI